MVIKWLVYLLRNFHVQRQIVLLSTILRLVLHAVNHQVISKFYRHIYALYWRKHLSTLESFFDNILSIIQFISNVIVWYTGSFKHVFEWVRVFMGTMLCTKAYNDTHFNLNARIDYKIHTGDSHKSPWPKNSDSIISQWYDMNVMRS